MAPSTRLAAQPERRKDYRRVAPATRAGSSRNPIMLEDTPPSQTPTAPVKKAKNSITDASKPARDSKGRFIKSDTSKSKPKPDRKKVVKVAAQPKAEKKPFPEKTECMICAMTKNTKGSFRASSIENACKHFQGVCDLCIGKQIKTKMAARQLTDAHLPCMFPKCEAVLDHTALKKVMTKALFAK